jgi:hypothetical protein
MKKGTAGGGSCGEADALTQRWLTYASDVVKNGEHGWACVAQGGCCLEPGAPQDLHWPGFLGADYQEGGLLVVGNVHRELSSGNFGVDRAAALAEVTLGWRSDDVSDQEYLDVCQELYLEGLSCESGWNVGGAFQPLLQATGLTWDQVAYTNAAKTQMPLERWSGATVRGCAARFPIPVLATSTLRADLVLTDSATARDQCLAAGVRVRYFQQRATRSALLERIRLELLEHGLQPPADVPDDQRQLWCGASRAVEPQPCVRKVAHNDHGIVAWLLVQMGGDAWTADALLRALRRQSAWLRQHPERVEEAARFANRHGIEQVVVSGTTRLRRRPASAV